MGRRREERVGGGRVERERGKEKGGERVGGRRVERDDRVEREKKGGVGEEGRGKKGGVGGVERN